MKATIVYDSGAMLEIDCEEVSVSRNKLTNELTGIDVKGIKKGSPRPLFWGIEHIVAVWTEGT